MRGAGHQQPAHYRPTVSHTNKRFPFTSEESVEFIDCERHGVWSNPEIRPTWRRKKRRVEEEEKTKDERQRRRALQGGMDGFTAWKMNEPFRNSFLVPCKNGWNILSRVCSMKIAPFPTTWLSGGCHLQAFLSTGTKKKTKQNKKKKIPKRKKSNIRTKKLVNVPVEGMKLPTKSVCFLGAPSLPVCFYLTYLDGKVMEDALYFENNKKENREGGREKEREKSKKDLEANKKSPRMEGKMVFLPLDVFVFQLTISWSTDVFHFELFSFFTAILKLFFFFVCLSLVFISPCWPMDLENI